MSVARHRRRSRVLDALVYAVGVTGITLGLGLVFALFVGGGLTTVKYVLFFVGWLLFAVGTFMLRPTAPYKEKRSDKPPEDDGEDDDGSRFGPTGFLGMGGGGDDTTTIEGGVPGDHMGEAESPYQRLVTRFVPDRYVIPPGERYSTGARIFLGGVFVLVTSILLEVGLGVPG